MTEELNQQLNDMLTEALQLKEQVLLIFSTLPL